MVAFTEYFKNDLRLYAKSFFDLENGLSDAFHTLAVAGRPEDLSFLLDATIRPVKVQYVEAFALSALQVFYSSTAQWKQDFDWLEQKREGAKAAIVGILMRNIEIRGNDAILSPELLATFKSDIRLLTRLMPILHIYLDGIYGPVVRAVRGAIELPDTAP